MKGLSSAISDLKLGLFEFRNLSRECQISYAVLDFIICPLLFAFHMEFYF